jgi:hypothetical protein
MVAGSAPVLRMLQQFAMVWYPKPGQEHRSMKPLEPAAGRQEQPRNTLPGQGTG